VSDNQEMILETASTVFPELADAGFDEAWSVIEEAGFNILLLDEAAGGFGGDWSDFYAVMREVGRYSIPAPLGELVLANWCAAEAGFELPAGPVSIGTVIAGELDGITFSGAVTGVPWGRHVNSVIAIDTGKLILLPLASASIVEHENIAGEPRDHLEVESVEVQVSETDIDLLHSAALMRVGQISGAASLALDMSIEHVNNRKQFGRPLAKFQAVQQSLAVFASNAAAVDSAGQAAAIARVRDVERDGASFEIAAAKLRANMAVGPMTSIAHQVHGAIGFTEEYPLHRLTRRMMGWRSEYGNDRFWAERLGQRVAGSGGSGLWETLTRRSD